MDFLACPSLREKRERAWLSCSADSAAVTYTSLSCSTDCRNLHPASDRKMLSRRRKSPTLQYGL